MDSRAIDECERVVFQEATSYFEAQALKKRLVEVVKIFELLMTAVESKQACV